MKKLTIIEKIETINKLTERFLNLKSSQNLDIYTTKTNSRIKIKDLKFGKFIYKTNAVYKRFYFYGSNSYRYYINTDLYSYLVKHILSSGLDSQFFKFERIF